MEAGYVLHGNLKVTSHHEGKLSEMFNRASGDLTSYERCTQNMIRKDS
jgi:hypothetical protein